MAIFFSIYNSVKTAIWGDTPQILQNNPEQVFKTQLSTFTMNKIGGEDCIERCCKYIKDILQDSDCDLTQKSQTTIQGYLDIFEKLTASADFHAAIENSWLPLDSASSLNKDFKNSLAEIIEDKWAVGIAQSFNVVMKKSGEEQILEAKRWTEQFFTGVDYFRQLKIVYDTGQHVNKLKTKVLNAFEIHLFEKMQKRVAAYAKRIEGMGSAPGDAAFLFAEGNNIDSLLGSSDSERGKQLLSCCVWNAFTVRQYHLANEILNDKLCMLLRKTFAEKVNAEDDH